MSEPISQLTDQLSETHDHYQARIAELESALAAEKNANTILAERLRATAIQRDEALRHSKELDECLTLLSLRLAKRGDQNSRNLCKPVVDEHLRLVDLYGGTLARQQEGASDGD